MRNSKVFPLTTAHSLVAAAALLLGSATLPAAAASNTATDSVTGSLGTTGIGLALSRSLSDGKWVTRLDGGHLSYSTSTREGNINYDADVKTTTGMASADYHFFGGRFKGSIGLAIMSSDISLEGRPNQAGLYNINGQTVPAGPNDFVRASLDLPSVAPYLGIGWSNLNEPEAGFKYYLDLGILIGGVDVGLSTSDNIRQAAGDANIEAERRKIEDEVDKGIVPVARFGLGLRFD